MQQFKPNEAVFILPKFAHLYPRNSAVVISVQANQFWPMFNEYTVEFADRSTARLFEFQIIEELSDYKTVVAQIVFDGRRQPVEAQVRGPGSGHIIFQTPEFDLDLKIKAAESRAAIMGQVLQRGTNALLKNIEVRLMTEGMPLDNATSDSAGFFKFPDAPRGPLNILVIIPQRLSRILGTVSI